MPPVDTLNPPPGSGPPAPPPPDTTAVPPDTTVAPPAPPPSTPPDTAPSPPPTPVVHTGIPFGPSVYTQGNSSFSLIPPSSLDSAFNAVNTDAHPPILLAKLEAARRANDRVLLSLAGSSEHYRDDVTGGFSFTKWKQRIDEFRGMDLASYIADGTLMGHFIMDEPSDPHNWNGHRVSLADIDEMARYSKEIWPDLPAVIRAWPDYLTGHDYRYLDATWVQYHSRFGPIDSFIDVNVRETKALGLALLLGLNVVAGGGEGGIPGYHRDKFAMTAAQVRSWGNALLDEPYACAFFMFRYNADYFARPDIRSAMAELSKRAAGLPERPCRRS